MPAFLAALAPLLGSAAAGGTAAAAGGTAAAVGGTAAGATAAGAGGAAAGAGGAAARTAGSSMLRTAGRMAIMRSASSTGHGVSATQFPQQSSTDNEHARWV